MRILGIDYGDKRVGLALSDPMGIVATGLPTLDNRGLKPLLASLSDIAKDREITAVVIGYPRNMDGSEGPACQKVKAFAQELERTLGVSVTLWDERMTSMQAERVLREAEFTNAKRKRHVDRMAAQLILQNFLDRSAYEKRARDTELD